MRFERDKIYSCLGIVETGTRHISFILAVDGTFVLACRGEHCSPARYIKDTFLLSYFSVKKSTKSNQRERSPLFESSSRVHELVARTMRGKCVPQRAERKSAVLPLPTISAIPRVRTCHTKKTSRFVHALSARPLKVHGGD